MGIFDPQFRDQTLSSNSLVAANATSSEFDNMAARMSGWALVEHNEDGTHNFNLNGNLVPIGSIVMWATNTPPAHWLICDGSQVSRTTYQTLFSLIGTTYGIGDGVTTFNLPDIRQRFPLGKAAAGTGSTLATTGGAIDHTHSVAGLSIPALSVSITTSTNGSHNHGGATGSHTHTYSATSGGPDNLYAANVFQGWTSGPSPQPPSNSHAHTTSGTTDGSTASISSDGSHSHTVSGSTGTGTSSVGSTGTNNPPYLVINFIILSGV